MKSKHSKNLELEFRDGKFWKGDGEVGWLGTTGYRMISFEGKQCLYHRLVWKFVYGDWPSTELDHIDGNKLNNDISNLRLTTRSKNMRNQKKIRGYFYVKAKNRWTASFSLNGKRIYIGCYKTEKEARAAYESAIAPHK